MHLPCHSVRARMACRRHSSRLRQRLMCHHHRMPSHLALASRLACPPLTSKGQDVRSCYPNRGLSTTRPHHRPLVCRSRIRMSLSSGCRVVNSELQLIITHLLSRNIMINWVSQLLRNQSLRKRQKINIADLIEQNKSMMHKLTWWMMTMTVQ